MQRGELRRHEVYAAAMFVYFCRNDWLMWSVGTNFPRGYKVQSSVRTHEPMLERVFPKCDLGRNVMTVLEDALIHERSFKDIARDGGARITRHRAGKELFRQSLGKFADVLKTVDERVL